MSQRPVSSDSNEMKRPSADTRASSSSAGLSTRISGAGSPISDTRPMSELPGVSAEKINQRPSGVAEVGASEPSISTNFVAGALRSTGRDQMSVAPSRSDAK